MNKMIATIAALTLASGSAFASANLERCNGQYLISAVTEIQAQVNPLVLEGIADGILNLKTFNPKVGPYSVFGLEPAANDKASQALRLMQSMQQIPGAIIECNSEIVLN
jgi:hypothetical protein